MNNLKNRDYYDMLHLDRKNWDALVPEICFVLYLCDAIDEFVHTEIIADQAAKTYPKSFSTLIGNKDVPDTYVVVMALKRSKSSKWRYAYGAWDIGWKLTPKGIKFAKRVEKKVLEKK